MQNPHSYNEFDEIYRPETRRLIEETGLNVDPHDLSRFAETLDPANNAGDSYWQITDILNGAVEQDERNYVSEQREEYRKRLTADSIERARWSANPYEEQKRFRKEEKALASQAERINDPRVWVLAKDENVWMTTHKLKVVEKLGPILDKEDLYLVVKLANFIGSPNHEVTFAEALEELNACLPKGKLRVICEVLLRDKKEGKTNESMRAKFKLIYELKEEVKENFKLAECILGQDVELWDLAWILKGKDFYKSNDEDYLAFHTTMKGLVSMDQGNGYLGREAELFFYWLPVCKGKEDIATLATLLPQVGYLQQGYATDTGVVQRFAEGSDALEKLKGVCHFFEGRGKSAWGNNARDLLYSLKEKSLSECKALLEWASKNIGEDKKIFDEDVYDILGRITAQNFVITEEYLQNWTIEFKKIQGLLAQEFEGYDRKDMLYPVLDCAFNAKVEDVQGMIEVYRAIQRAHQPEGAKKQQGSMKAWLGTEILWGLNAQQLGEVKDTYRQIPPKKVDLIVETIPTLRETYGKDHGKFIRCIEVLAKYRSSTIQEGVRSNLLRDIYQSDVEKMDQTLGILDKVTLEQSGPILRTLATLKSIYIQDTEKLTQLVGVLNGLTDSDDEKLRINLRLVETLKPTYGDDLQKLQELVVILNTMEVSDSAFADAIILLQDIYKSDYKVLNRVIDSLTKYKKSYPEASIKDFADKLFEIKELIKENPDRLEVVQHYLELTPIFDKKTVEKFIHLYENEGEESAKTYLERLISRAKGMVGSGVPTGQREMEEYKFLVHYVYPKGNYSDHDRNLACGDRLDHIKEYTFDTQGYPVVLSGLNGYGLKEGVKENPDLLSQYSKRLQKMRAFVSSRGPDSTALQEAYEQKIEGTFEQKAETGFRSIPNLSVKEKLFCLIVTEALRKAKEVGLAGARNVRGEEAKVFAPDEEILDLVVEYKYAFHEDLEAYVQRSADDAKQYGDSVSQNYILWSELSVIYGENMKHVMRNDILGAITTEPHFGSIVDAYVQTVGELTTDDGILEKARERVKNTLDNERIPSDRKSEVAWKSIWTLFSSNLKFPDEELRKRFEERLRESAGVFLAEPSTASLEEILPKLLSLRNERRFEIGAKVEDLLSRDIGLIFKELAKYEELAEVEAKETTMNGPRDKLVKKSSKKRNIRGHITKTQETANARMGAYLCIAGDGKMWENPNYFELVLEDEETHRCVGLVMMLKIEAEDGKKYLWFGPNPFESFLTQVSAKKTYDYMYQTVCKFAEENNFDGVVIPSAENSILGACTNRGGEFPGLIKASRLKDTKGNIKIVQFGETHNLGGNYGYKDGALIWEKTTSK